ncbi:MAG: response regulator [Sporomusaceae bacterium]|nr:response regulator [Sporomusaceae bacterium]
MKLLFVTQDELWLQRLREQCQKKDFCCDVFEDVAAAISAYRQQSDEYSLVIVDFSGDFDGFDFTQKLRAVSTKQSILAVNSMIEPQLLLKAALSGISFFLPKAVEMDDFLALLCQISDQFKAQKKEQDEKDGLAKEYIRLRREYGEMQVQIKKYEALLAMQQ